MGTSSERSHIKFLILADIITVSAMKMSTFQLWTTHLTLRKEITPQNTLANLILVEFINHDSTPLKLKINMAYQNETSLKLFAHL